MQLARDRRRDRLDRVPPEHGRASARSSASPIDHDGRDEGAPVLALDPHGAGLHQRVILYDRRLGHPGTCGDAHSPLRNMICAIVDPPATEPMRLGHVIGRVTLYQAATPPSGAAGS